MKLNSENLDQVFGGVKSFKTIITQEKVLAAIIADIPERRSQAITAVQLIKKKIFG